MARALQSQGIMSKRSPESSFPIYEVRRTSAVRSVARWDEWAAEFVVRTLFVDADAIGTTTSRNQISSHLKNI